MSAEVHTPTKEDLARIKPQPDKLKVSGDGVFATLQGEGVTAGKPAVFLRLHYCNLTCGFPSGWQCDTWYTWDKRTPEYWREPEDWGYEETAAEISREWDENHGGSQETGRRLVITGGEPLLQQRKIAKLLQFLPGWAVEIETNGTILPLPELHSCQFNCSPKLENSGNRLVLRYKPNVLRRINSLPNSWFKFVAMDPRDLDEIDSIVAECGLSSHKILIMPEGHTAEEVARHASVLAPEVAKRGWSLTLRKQLIWFGPKRRT